MKLIVGLGNPGPQYARTRHNIGFMVADMLANKLIEKSTVDWPLGWELKDKFKAEIIETDQKGEKIILAKPQTFMNLSGEAVQRIVQFYKLVPSDVWVIFDDVDVPFGRLRLRTGGASGHQGVSSLIRTVGQDFVRVRVGISLNDRNREPSEEYVLKPFNTGEREQLPKVIELAAAVIERQLSADTLDETTFDLLS